MKATTFYWQSLFVLLPLVCSTIRCPQENVETRCYFNYLTLDLWCDQSNFTAIPKPADIESYAPPEYALKIFINGSCIQAITQDDMKKYPNIIVFDASKNQLKSIDLSAFKYCPDLSVIHLSNNSIVHVYHRSLTDQQKLEELDLSRNQLTEIERSTFSELRNLTVLRLNHNRLTKVHEDLLTNTVNLRILAMGNNHLTEWQRSDKKALSKLNELDLDNNHLAVISYFFLEGLASLRKFSIKNNNLETVETYSFIHSPHLTHIDLRNNNLKYLHGQLFSHLCKLRRLLISGNRLMTPQRNWFSPLTIAHHYHANEEQILDNPWSCDCDSVDFLLFLDELRNSTIQSQISLAKHLSIECASPTILAGQIITAREIQEMLNCSLAATSPKPSRRRCVKTTKHRRIKTIPNERSKTVQQRGTKATKTTKPFGIIWILTVLGIVILVALLVISLRRFKKHQNSKI